MSEPLPRLPPDVIYRIFVHLLPTSHSSALSLAQTTHEYYQTLQLVHTFHFHAISLPRHYHFIKRHLPRSTVRHLVLSVASLRPALARPWSQVIPQLHQLASLDIPTITDPKSLHSIRALLKGSAKHITLRPNRLTRHIHIALQRSQVTHVAVLPHDAWFGVCTEALLNAVTSLTHVHVTYPSRFIHHEIITAISNTARSKNLHYRISIPFYDYLPFHKAHSEAPIRQISLGIVRERFACLFRDIVKWQLLERVWIHSCEEGALGMVMRALSGRVWKVVIERCEKPKWIGNVPGGWTPLRKEVIRRAIRKEIELGEPLEICECDEDWGSVRVGLVLYGLAEPREPG